jgi:hypothetical protein
VVVVIRDGGDDCRREAAVKHPPICPRCQTAENVRPSPLSPTLWSCRWCAYLLWVEHLELLAKRAVAEAEQITRRSA